jgi:sugar phosphate isomerase/epimerase
MVTKEAMMVSGGRDSRALETLLPDAEQQMMVKMAKVVEQIDTTLAKMATKEAVEVDLDTTPRKTPTEATEMQQLAAEADERGVEMAMLATLTIFLRTLPLQDVQQAIETSQSGELSIELAKAAEEMIEHQEVANNSARPREDPRAAREAEEHDDPLGKRQA